MLGAVALPACADWELLRANDEQRLSIDAKSVKARDGETNFKYLVDFRQFQGEVGGKYRSIVVGAALRCKDRRIAMRSFELYSAATGEGVLLASPKPSKEEGTFQSIKKGSSDEDLYKRLCVKGAAKPPKK